jgi:arylsulfatase A-like enzyme
MPDSKPNILVIWGDDIGITNLSCYSDGLMGYLFGGFASWPTMIRHYGRSSRIRRRTTVTCTGSPGRWSSITTVTTAI